MYDYGARFYDPSICRFTTVDPKAEQFSFQTPYSYAANNPVKYIDVNGENPGLPVAVAVWAYRAYKAYRVARALRDLSRAARKEPVAVNPPGGTAPAPPRLRPVIRNVTTGNDVMDDFTNTLLVTEDGSKVHKNSTESLAPAEVYTNTDQDGKPYHGVGDVEGDRAEKSRQRLEKENPGKTFETTDRTEKSNRSEAYKEEDNRIQKDDGAKSYNNYNKRNPPGKELNQSTNGPGT